MKIYEVWQQLHTAIPETTVLVFNQEISFLLTAKDTYYCHTECIKKTFLIYITQGIIYARELKNNHHSLLSLQL